MAEPWRCRATAALYCSDPPLALLTLLGSPGRPDEQVPEDSDLGSWAEMIHQRSITAEARSLLSPSCFCCPLCPDPVVSDEPC